MTVNLAAYEIHHTGTVVHEVISNPSSAMSAAAHEIARYFLANMDADIMPDDRIHALNLAARGGVEASREFHGVEADQEAKIANVSERVAAVEVGGPRLV